MSHLHVQLGEGKEGWGMFRIMLEGLLVQLDGPFIVPLVGCMFSHLCTHAEGRKVVLMLGFYRWIFTFYVILNFCFLTYIVEFRQKAKKKKKGNPNQNVGKECLEILEKKFI